MSDQERCPRRDPRGHQCEPAAGHAGEHQRQPAPLTWPEWLGSAAPRHQQPLTTAVAVPAKHTDL